MSRYENGSSLTRGEFVAQMERVDQTLEGIVERLDRIEERVNRPRVIFFSSLSTVGQKVLIIIIAFIIAYLATYLEHNTGIGIDPFSVIGL